MQVYLISLDIHNILALAGDSLGHPRHPLIVCPLIRAEAAPNAAKNRISNFIFG